MTFTVPTPALVLALMAMVVVIVAVLVVIAARCALRVIDAQYQRALREVS